MENRLSLFKCTYIRENLSNHTNSIIYTLSYSASIMCIRANYYVLLLILKHLQYPV